MPVGDTFERQIRHDLALEVFARLQTGSNCFVADFGNVSSSRIIAEKQKCWGMRKGDRSSSPFMDLSVLSRSDSERSDVWTDTLGNLMQVVLSQNDCISTVFLLLSIAPSGDKFAVSPRHFVECDFDYLERSDRSTLRDFARFGSDQMQHHDDRLPCVNGSSQAAYFRSVIVRLPDFLSFLRE
jgi:hypothetical protein